MRFTRAAVITLFSPPPGHFDTTPYAASNGMTVEVLCVVGNFDDYTGTDGPPLGHMNIWGTFGAESSSSGLMVWVGVRFSCEEVTAQEGDGINVPAREGAACDEAIQEYADLLAVVYNCVRRVHAPIASVGVQATTAAEEQLLAEGPYYAAASAQAANVTPSKLMAYASPPRLLSLTSDRLDGVALLAESLSQSTLTGRARVLFQFFERAFKARESLTIDPLTAFLISSPLASIMNYKQSEVHHWMKVLRPTSVHADRSRPYAKDDDYVLHLARMEQAAYDCLFNKKQWRGKGSERRVGVDFAGAINEIGVMTIFKDRRGLAVHFDMRDQLNTFPLSFDGVPAEAAQGWTWLGAKPEVPSGT